MKLNPRRARTTALAFGKGRLGQMTADGVSVRGLVKYDVAIRLELEKPVGVVALADGSLFCPGSKATLRLFSHDQKPRSYPMMPLLPGSQIFGDRVDPERVWSLSRGGTTLFGFALGDTAATMLAPSAWVPLDEFDHRSVTSLRDGSFMYTTAAGYSRFSGKGAKEAVKSNSTDVFRILPGSRPDTVWVLRLDRRVSLFSLLDGKLARLQTVTLEKDPFDADSAGGFLAVLELDQPDDAPPSFLLEVFDVSGERRFSEVLPAVESFDDDWVERMLENRNLAVSADPPRIAIGGPTALTVFDAAAGARLFDEP